MHRRKLKETYFLTNVTNVTWRELQSNPSGLQKIRLI